METNRGPDYHSVSVPRANDTCARCGGLMVIEYYMDLQDDTGQIGLTAWRCTSCGEVIDPTILRNRINPVPNLLYGTKQRNYAQQVNQDESTKSEKKHRRGAATRDGE
jgi:ribosomal protein S27AE